MVPGGRPGGGRPGGGRGKGGGPRSRFGRRSPPPESTGEESKYLFRLRDRQTPVVVALADGEELRGTVEYYDRDMIKIVPPTGPGRFIRKEDIRFLKEAD